MSTTNAGRWRQTGWDLAAARSGPGAHVARGHDSDDAMRVSVVREGWPEVGPHVLRHIREGWRLQRAGAPRPTSTTRKPT